MSRIGSKFTELRGAGRKAFIAYLMAGDPSIPRTKELVAMLEECGTDILELGVPFSDPLADGPTIQSAAQRALAQGVTLRTVFELVREIRTTSEIPVILMLYYNLVLRYGEEQFAKEAAEAGVDGVIIPDLPPDEAGVLMKCARRTGLDLVFLLAPTSTEERMKRVAEVSRGFIYYVSITGITGAKLALDPGIERHIADIRKLTDTPVAVGFGISNPDEAAAVARFADGVIVGSAIVKQTGEPDHVLRGYLTALREAIR